MKQVAKRFWLCFLVVVLVFSLVSCSAYPEQKGTKEERMKIASLDGHLYPTYDFYRFVFLMQKQYLEKRGEESPSLFEACDEAAMTEIFRVYALFSLCEKNEIDPFGREVDKKVEEMLKELIEGEGGYGSFDAYLEAIKKNYMTDSVSRLYLRYAVCEELLAQKMVEEGSFSTDDATLLAYYNGENAANVMWLYLSPEALYVNPALLQTITSQAQSADDEDFYKLAVQYQNPYLSDLAKEMENGMLIGKYHLTEEFAALTDAIFSLKEGETSAAVQSTYSETYQNYGVYIVRRLPKEVPDLTDEAIKSHIQEEYMLHVFYEKLAEEAAFLEANCRYYDFYNTLTLETVKAP
ncbi:MAG: hypothetical protein J6K61_06790 [Clostridia bacterium]|nr:hypothetical protein [Clostridia bacterium]